MVRGIRPLLIYKSRVLVCLTSLLYFIFSQVQCSSLLSWEWQRQVDVRWILSYMYNFYMRISIDCICLVMQITMKNNLDFWKIKMELWQSAYNGSESKVIKSSKSNSSIKVFTIILWLKSVYYLSCKAFQIIIYSWFMVLCCCGNKVMRKILLSVFLN